jgi:hypothetical protein
MWPTAILTSTVEIIDVDANNSSNSFQLERPFWVVACMPTLKL